MQDYLEVCEKAARAGGRVLIEWQGRAGAAEKAPKDLVTQADLASQEVIRDILLDAFPDHGFVGEEDDLDQTGRRRPMPTEATHGTGYRWLVDPLDGTANYVHQLRTFAVSVALECDGEILVGVVFDPTAQECYSAALSKGAFLNGSPLRVSGCARLREALVSSSFSANVQRDSPEIARFVEVLVSCQALRRLGSAALNLCYLAAGRLDAYWATSVSSWDVAAGVLLVREAGGVVTSVDGSPFELARPRFAASATQQLHTELIDVLARASAG